MDLRQLEYFAAVARHRHFGRAAEAIYVTQPALSQQVRRLETELGVALLNRTSRGVELTAAGAELLARADAILAGVAAARAAMDEHAGVVRGAVRVAATAADALRLPEGLAAFHREHPGVRLALRQASATEVVELVRRGAVDLAVLAGEPQGLTATPLPDEPLRVLVAPDDPLATAPSTTVQELRGRPFVLPEPGTALRELIMRACQDAGFSPVPLLEVADPATTRFLVHAGLGVALAPASWLGVPGAEVAALALEPPPRHRLSLVTAGELSPAGALLHAALLAHFSADPRP